MFAHLVSLSIVPVITQWVLEEFRSCQISLMEYEELMGLRVKVTQRATSKQMIDRHRLARCFF
ncbi:hypothetical protein H9649_02165 [Sporosarcina sp. Sa2YVA2]|uniref:Uncharacterized protein n=1 Tax=Sporosarcina quadrami TaxID=2762234 RepID=A0ABR8U5Q9_9BACL|nr:hypothetical protein [Sporosarcina quadrami]MBD7983371.1 hypothetical protein [Sporosarcina quadrami]